MKNNKIFYCIFTVLYIVSNVHYASAQSKKLDNAAAKKALIKGNKQYRLNNIPSADSAYQQSIKADHTYYKAQYNLGNAKYRLNQMDAARNAYQGVLKNNQLSKDEQAMVHHNIGNTFLKDENYKEAIESYKKSLRLNPYNYDTKYNLAFAQRKMKNGGGGGKNNNDKKENKNEKEQQEKQEKARQDMTKEEAEAILNAMRQDEQQLQNKNKENNSMPKDKAKDW